MMSFLKELHKKKKRSKSVVNESTWFCNFETSWFKSSFVFFKLSIRLLENPGLEERGGLGLLAYGDTDLELRGGVAGGVGAILSFIPF
jgi:hypothetical protein